MQLKYILHQIRPFILTEAAIRMELKTMYVEDYADSKVSISPNPSNGIFTVTSNKRY